MNIPIKYNDEIDEFTYDLTLQMRLEKYLKKHFDVGYAISNMCNIYLLGGAIRDLTLAKKPKDLDFVILGRDNIDFINLLFKKLNIKYTYNRFGGFKFEYNATSIDLWLTDDLFSSIEYNVDGLFFDLNNCSLISLTYDDFLKNGLRKVNDENNIENGRVKKLIEFESIIHN